MLNKVVVVVGSLVAFICMHVDWTLVELDEV